MKRVFLICLAIIVMATSCKKGMTQKEFGRYQVALFCAYYTNNADGAKNVLYKDLNTLSEWQSNQVEGTDFLLDYDGLKALDHERLFLIYWRAHATNEMESEYRQVLKYQASSCEKRGLPPPPVYSYDKFANEIEARDERSCHRLETLDTNIDLVQQR